MKYLEIFFEGIHDPYVKKAFFLVGTPGSGKTFIRKKIFPFGVKPVDIDIIFEHLLKIEKNVKMLKNVDYESEEYKKIYEKSRKLVEKLLNLYVKNNLGIILDGTGRNIELIKSTKEMLENIGYETFLIYVYTDLETSLKRNAERSRQLDPSVVKRIHEQVTKLIPQYIKLFDKNNILVVDNSDENVDLEKYSKIIQSWLKK